MALADNDRSLIVKLGYDSSDLKKGFADAKRDAQEYKAKLALLHSELKTAQVRFAQEFTRQHLAEVQKRIQASKVGASQEDAAYLQSYRDRLSQINNLKASYVELQNQVKRSQAAGGLFNAAQGGAPWPVAREFTGLGMLQAFGMVTGGVMLTDLLRGIATGLKDAALSGGEYGHSLELISQKTGIAIPALEQFEFIGKLTGLSLDDLIVGTRKFSSAMVGGPTDFEGSVNRGAKVLAALGINTRDAQNNVRPMNDVLLDLAGVFAQNADGAEKSKIAVELFGRSGLNLVPFLNRGRDGIRELLSAMGDTVPVEELAKSYEKLELANAKLDIANLRLKAGLVPLLDFWGQLKDGVAAYLESLSAVETQQRALAGAAGVKLTPAGEAMLTELTTPQTGVYYKGQLIGQQGEAARQQKLGEGEAEYRRRFAAGIAPGAVLTDEQRALGFILTQQGKVQDKLIAEREIRKQVTDEMKKAARIAAGEKEDRAAERTADRIKAAQQALTEARTKAQQAVTFAEAKGELSPEAASLLKAISLRRELQTLEKEQVDLTGAALLDNLEKQKSLTGEIASAEADRIRIWRDAEEKYLSARALERVNALSRLFGGPQFTVAGPTQTQQLESELAAARFLIPPELQTKKTLSDELRIREQLAAEQRKRIADLLSEGAATGKTAEQVQKLGEQYTKNETAIKGLKTALEKPSGLGAVLDSLLDVAQKFAVALPKGFVEWAAQLEFIRQASKGLVADIKSGLMQAEGVTPESEQGQAIQKLSGIKEVFGGMTKSWKDFTGALTKSAPKLMALLTTIGVAFSRGVREGMAALMQTAGTALMGMKNPYAQAAGAALIAGSELLQAFTKKARRISKEIAQPLSDITNAYNSGSLKLKDAIEQTNAERADAINRLSGRKGGQKELESLLPQFDQTIASLKAKQKTVFDSFERDLAVLRLPEQFRQIGQEIQTVTERVTEFLSAGGDALTAQEYTARSIQNIYADTGRSLRDSELEAIDLLQRRIDLESQREKILSDAADREKTIRQGLGLAPMLTPAQKAAADIKAIETQKAEQLKALDIEEARLDAEIGNQQEIFKLTGDTATLEQVRLAIMREQTAEQTAQLLLIRDWLSSQKDIIAAVQTQFGSNAALWSLPQVVSGRIQGGGQPVIQFNNSPVTLELAKGMSGAEAWKIFTDGLTCGATTKKKFGMATG